MLPVSAGNSLNPLTSLLPWASFLEPFIQEFERRQEQKARELFLRLLNEQAASSTKKEKDEELLNKPQTAALLNIRPKTVDAWKTKGILPSHKLGGRIFYKRGEVLAALQAQTQPDGRRKYARRAAANKKTL
jgi:hypothetical protein